MHHFGKSDLGKTIQKLFELNIGTPVTHILENVYINFDSLMPFFFLS